MAQIQTVLNYLSRDTSRKGKGVTVANITKFTGVPKSNVYKRVHDLRVEGHRIFTNTKMVNGKCKSYYRLAG